MAETKDHADWELIGQCAKHWAGKEAQVLQDAYEEIEGEEDSRLYHGKGWCRELWIESLGLDTVLPPPEEQLKVKTAIGAARAQARASGPTRRGDQTVHRSVTPPQRSHRSLSTWSFFLMATRKPRSTSAKSASKSSNSRSAATTSARSTVSGPAHDDARGDAGDPLVAKMQGTQALAAAMPFNANKASEYGEASRQSSIGAYRADAPARIALVILSPRYELFETSRCG